MHALLLKRAYEPATESDGARVLVDRLWPRGLSKEKAKIDYWAKDVAPSHELRRWFGHEAARWEEFRERYHEELKGPGAQEEIELLRAMARKGRLTLLYAARDEEKNNAAVLRDYLREARRRA
ncbi:DUF488 domain-containing protein [Methylocystis parvus]|uniref:DUF488 family protein n=1 Tax=Methylocystis parvus TaxID=134 RepID=A0A6B8M416_9HYPH|nr:DUF488 family protein [Methylocystis parvus]QGM97058.1 DUF488 family protein [Methylocystis parvus]WBJ99042.1 DUF488 family protein [Methylocystis parvus OBBP]